MVCIDIINSSHKGFIQHNLMALQFSEESNCCTIVGAHHHNLMRIPIPVRPVKFLVIRIGLHINPTGFVRRVNSIDFLSIKTILAAVIFILIRPQNVNNTGQAKLHQVQKHGQLTWMYIHIDLLCFCNLLIGYWMSSTLDQMVASLFHLKIEGTNTTTLHDKQTKH